MLRRERLLQCMAVAVGVQTDLCSSRSNRVARAWSRPERILVRGKLDAVLDAVLALELFDRLARHIRRDAAHAGSDQRCGIERHRAKGCRPGALRMGRTSTDAIRTSGRSPTPRAPRLSKHRARIRPQDTEKRRLLLQILERMLERRLVGMTDHIDEEDVVPFFPARRA